MITADKITEIFCAVDEFHGFKLHLVCNDRGEIITFCFTGANVDDRDPKVWAVLTKTLYGKLFADRGYKPSYSILKKTPDSLNCFRDYQD